MGWNSNVNKGTILLMDFHNTDPDDKYFETLRFKEVVYLRLIFNQYGVKDK